MSELKPCDFLGNEIRMGDEVAFFAIGYRIFTRGIVVRITPKCLFIDYDNSWNYDHHEEHTRQEQKQVIDLTALNRRAQPANEPLTLDEMNALDHEPIYVLHTGGKWTMNGWHIATASSYQNHGRCDLEIDNGNTTMDMQNYGKTWLAYDHKPGGELL